MLQSMAKDLPRKSWHLIHGQDAEHLAARYLESRGLVIIARNLRFKVGELDLVCLDDLVLVIVEVRQRRNDDFGGALASITHWKQRKLIRAAQCFLQRAKGMESLADALRRRRNHRAPPPRPRNRVGKTSVHTLNATSTLAHQPALASLAGV